MLNSEVIFLEIVTGTSDFGGNLLKIISKKKKKKRTRFFWNLRSVAEGNTTIFFIGLILIKYCETQELSHQSVTCQASFYIQNLFVLLTTQDNPHFKIDVCPWTIIIIYLNTEK